MMLAQQWLRHRQVSRIWRSALTLRWFVVTLWLALMSVMMIIPFWSRYYLLLLPLGLLLVSPWLTVRKWLLILVLGISLFQFSWYYYQSPAERLNFAMQTWNAGRYADLYNFLPIDWRRSHSRAQFVQDVTTQCGAVPPLTRANITDSWLVWANSPISIQAQQRYRQPSGQLIRQHHQWYITPETLSAWCES